MNDEIIFENVKFSDISINDKKKCNLSKSQYKILLENPFKESEDIPAQITAKSNDAIVGSVLCFPAKIIADKQIYVCNSGSSLYVNPNFRGHGIGTKLGIKRLNVSKNKISLAAGLSNMSLPIYKKLGCFIFYPARYNLICNSKVLLNKNSKDPIFTVLSIILNSILKIQQYLIITYTKTHLCHFNIYEINEATDEIEEIIKTDKHRFKELHNKEWFNWHLNNCMVEHPLNKLHL